MESVCQEKEGGCREELVTIGEVVGIFSRWLDEIVSERIIHAFIDLLVWKIISGRGAIGSGYFPLVLSLSSVRAICSVFH